MLQRILVVFLLFLSLCSGAQAELIDRGNGLIYDDVLDVTWLQDASQGGTRTWSDAVAWADTLNFRGFDNWRLPLIDLNLDGTIADCSVATEMACRDNEPGHLFYHSFAGVSGDNLTGNQGLIESIQFAHWSGTVLFSPVFAAAFLFDGGGVVVGSSDAPLGAWAVRPGDVDADADGVLENADNCLLASNPDQRDTDADGIGNLCDPDVATPNDCDVNFLDLNVYRTNFFQPGDFDTDNNGDGQTNFLDLNIVRNFFFGAPGPSGLPNACTQLSEGEVCNPGASLCDAGLTCCYPCGIPGCDYVCEVTCAPGDPGCVDGCFLRP